jgi:hypothetical protein
VGISGKELMFMTEKLRSKDMAKLIISIFVSLMLSGVAAPLAEAATAYNGRVAYMTNDSPNKIDSINPDPGDLTHHVIAGDSTTPYGGPAYSPNGTKLLYIIEYAPTDITIANYDGTNPTIPVESAFYGTASWYPNGTQLAVTTRYNGAVFNIENLNLSNGALTALTNYAYTVRNPQVSPDGTKIVFSSTNDDDIYVMNANGTGVTNLTNNDGTNSYPSWSPDGLKIIYHKGDGGSGHAIGLMNANGSGKTTVGSALISENPIYSPDGAKIAYIDTSNHLHIMKSDGTNDASYANNAQGGLTWQAMVLGPASSNPNPSLSLSDNKASLDVPALYTDPYGGTINKSSVAVTGGPSYGTAKVDSATGVITYTSGQATASAGNILSRVAGIFFPKVSAAASTDSFTYRVCSNSGATLCSTGTATVNLLGAPGTGYGSDNTGGLITSLIVAGLVAMAAGICVLGAKAAKARG